MNNKTDIEKDIKIAEQLITTKFNNDYSIDSADKQAIENILADRERLEKENKENRIRMLMYKNLRKCFQKMIEEILGEGYYNMGMDTYTCDKLACEGIINKKVKIIFKGKDKKLESKANKYDTLLEKIRRTDIELANMKVEGEVFTTAVNFARKELQELLIEK